MNCSPLEHVYLLINMRVKRLYIQVIEGAKIQEFKISCAMEIYNASLTRVHCILLIVWWFVHIVQKVN